MNRTFTGEKSECCHDSKMQANLDGKKMEESSELQSWDYLAIEALIMDDYGGSFKQANFPLDHIRLFVNGCSKMLAE